MKKENNNLKKSLETLLVAIICCAFVLSFNKSCTNKANNVTKNNKIENKQIADSVSFYMTAQSRVR